jgi:hypothetical protein
MTDGVLLLKDDGIHTALWIVWATLAVLLAIALIVGRRRMKDEVARMRKLGIIK